VDIHNINLKDFRQLWFSPDNLIGSDSDRSNIDSEPEDDNLVEVASEISKKPE
jgi:hypothetical protein